MKYPLTHRTTQLLSMIKEPGLREEIIQLFDSECTLTGPPSEKEYERVRFSVIKLALEGPDMFKVARELYNTDVRDLYVNAEFANDALAHSEWCNKTLQEKEQKPPNKAL